MKLISSTTCFKRPLHGHPSAGGRAAPVRTGRLPVQVPEADGKTTPMPVGRADPLPGRSSATRGTHPGRGNGAAPAEAARGPAGAGRRRPHQARQLGRAKLGAQPALRDVLAGDTRTTTGTTEARSVSCEAENAIFCDFLVSRPLLNNCSRENC